MLLFRVIVFIALLSFLDLATTTPFLDRAVTSRPVEIKQQVHGWCNDARLKGIFSGKSVEARSSFVIKVSNPTRIAVEDRYQSESITSGEMGLLLCRLYFTKGINIAATPTTMQSRL